MEDKRLSNYVLIATTSCVIWRKLKGNLLAVLLLTSPSLCRFGGGSELLRDGDKNHIWHVLEQGMVYAFS